MLHLESFSVLFASSVFLAGSFLGPARPVHIPLPVPSTVQGCIGCLGSGGSAAASGGTCGGMVSISIDMESGQCKWFQGPEPRNVLCRQFKACKPTVMRSWSGIGAGNPLDFCVIQGGAKLCLDPKPDSGDGSGSDSRPSADMSCTGETRSFSIDAPSCGLSATAEATCSACESAL